MTTEGLRYIQIRENTVRESVANAFIKLHHIAGKVNIADLFTKEDRDTKHFLSIRDIITKEVPKQTYHEPQQDTSASEGGVNQKP